MRRAFWLVVVMLVAGCGGGRKTAPARVQAKAQASAPEPWEREVRERAAQARCRACARAWQREAEAVRLWVAPGTGGAPVKMIVPLLALRAGDSGAGGPPPAAPSGLTAEAISLPGIGLSWSDNSSDETGFEVQRSPDSSTWSTITTTAADAVGYPDPAPSGTHYYRVRAINAAGESAWSNTAGPVTI